jgi:hypothetical protein
MTDTLLTTDDNTTGDSGDSTTETVIDRFDADGNKTEDGGFDAEGKPIESGSDEAGDDKGDKGDKGGKDDKGDDDEESGAPESYEQFTVPEGIEIDETVLTEFSEVAKELNLNQSQAQRLIDLESKRAEASQQAMQEAFETQQEQWVKELKDDKDFGGDSFDSNLGLAVKVINKFGGPELKEVLDTSGMGNNPELVKMFNKIGKAISEDSLDSDSDNNAGTEKTLADRLYPNQASG